MRAPSGDRLVVAGFRTSQGDVPAARLLSSLQQTDNNKPTLSRAPIVLANGAWVPKLTAELDVYTPIYPVKGLTLLFNRSDKANNASSSLPGTSKIKDLPRPNQPGASAELRLLFRQLQREANGPHSNKNASPIIYQDRVMAANCTATSLSISAFSELDGWSLYPNNRMKNGLVERTKLLYPQLFEEERGRCAVISGLRPVSFDGKPIVGHLHPKYENVFVNSGFGNAGLSMAAGAAVVVADMITDAVLASSGLAVPCMGGGETTAVGNVAGQQQSTNSVDRGPQTIEQRQGTLNNNKTDDAAQRNQQISNHEDNYSSFNPAHVAQLLSPYNRAQYSRRFTRLCQRRWKESG